MARREAPRETPRELADVTPAEPTGEAPRRPLDAAAGHARQHRGITVREAVRSAAQRLAAAGLAEPHGEARRLVAAAAQLAAIDLVAGAERCLDPTAAARIEDLVAGRCLRTPLSRLTGEREFFGRPFKLSPATLDPRPDTEIVVEAVLRIARETGLAHRPCHILDVGTGSGAILVCLLAELPLARGTGIDISAEAVATARANALLNGVGDRADFRVADMRARQALPAADLLVSNPPYVASGDIAGLDPEVRLHDPLTALDGGPDGLAFYRALAPALLRLPADGALVLEVGAGQSDRVAAILTAQERAVSVRTYQDYSGHTRVVAALPQSRIVRD